MSIKMAKTKAFHFGRPAGAKMEAASIGLYGIGMKRALFKIGQVSTVRSCTGTEAFEVVIDAPAWEAKDAKEPWTFDLTVIPLFEPSGTKIEISVLTAEAAAELGTQAFASMLRKYIARDYSFFLHKGFGINLNTVSVTPYKFELKQSEELQPLKFQFEQNGVTVEITAGLAGIPSDDESPAVGISDIDYYGWFVVCNDRIIIAADKTERTVWGDEGFARWHPQYNGFMGIASFRASDPSKLPWTTTKRDVDRLSPVYRQAVAQMKLATQQYIDYSSARKVDLENAKAVEARAASVPVREVSTTRIMKLPTFSGEPRTVTVSFQAKKADVKRAAEALGSPSMPATRVGTKAFEYFLENEVGE